MNRRELLALLLAAIPGVAWLRSFRRGNGPVGTIVAFDRERSEITVEWRYLNRPGRPLV